jgi:hypothetical protein
MGSQAEISAEKLRAIGEALKRTEERREGATRLPRHETREVPPRPPANR